MTKPPGRPRPRTQAVHVVPSRPERNTTMTTYALPPSANGSGPSVEDLMPKARRLAALAGNIPSIRSLKRDLSVGEPKAKAVHQQLVAEFPDTPQSPVGPYPANLSGAYPAAISVPPAAAPIPRHGWRRAGALILPLLLVNAAALYGQAGWAYDHLGRGWVIAGLFAAAVESIGIYLAYEAHAAMMAGDASARLRLGSYLIGALVGVLNYAHFAGPAYSPNPVALTFGLLSSISPWLWAIRSRSLNRDRLRELGQVDPRAVRFSILRWALFPIRTGRAFRGAVWAGIVQPAEAVTQADEARAARRG